MGKLTSMTPSQFSLPSFMEDKVDFRALFFSLWAEKWLILAITVVMTLIGFFFAMTKTPQYQANVLLQVENKQSGMFGNNPLGMLGKGSNSAEVQIALIKSRFILIPVVESLGLDISATPNYFPFFGGWFARRHANEIENSLFGLNQYAWGGEHIEVERLQLPLAYQGKSFKVIAGEKNSYDLYTRDGEFILRGKVGQLAQTNVEGAAPLSILIKALKAHAGTEFFLSKLSSDYMADQIATQLQITDLGQLYQNEKTGVLQLSLIGSDPASVVKLLNAIAVNAVKKDMLHKSIEANKTIKFLQAQLPLVKNSLDKTETSLNEYRKKSGTLDVSIKTQMIIKQLANIQKEIEKTDVTRIVLLQQYTPLHPYVVTVEGKKKALQAELLSLQKQLQALPSSDKTTVSLMRDIKVKSQLYLKLLHKIQELEVVKAGTVSDVRVLSAATFPNGSLPMGRFVTIAGSILAGIVLGTLIVFVRKAFHRYVDDPNWLEHHFGIPTFAIIPYSGEQKTNMQAYKGQHARLPLLAQTQPRDLSIEALRSLRTSLQFALLDAKNNIISIMGISPGIGKSFVSANFSHILADTGKRILLIDGDIRKGYLHDYFGKSRGPGLSEAVTGEVEFEHVIQKTHLPHLDFISTGKIPPNPSELLMSSRFKEILDLASSRYDLVIVDTAPILAVTDGTIIGNYAGVNFLLVAWGKHQAEEIELAMKRLQSNGVRVQGVIVNTTHPRNPVQGRYNYNYAYGT